MEPYAYINVDNGKKRTKTKKKQCSKFVLRYCKQIF